MLDVVRDLEGVAGFVGVSVTQHVDRPCREVFGVRLEVAHIGLGVAAGSVQEHQRRVVGVTGMQVPGAYAAGVEIALRERDALQVAPHALELRHPVPLPWAQSKP